MTPSHIPSEADVLEYFDRLSNWGRWGPDDVLGTLNHITPPVRVAAAGLVRTGETVSCAWDIDTTPSADQNDAPPQRFMRLTGEGLRDKHRVYAGGFSAEDRGAGASEYIGLIFHGWSVTHIDALSHFSWDATMYNNIPAERVGVASGATTHDVRSTANGIVTRGILIDAPRSRDVPWLEPGDAVHADELDRICSEQGVTAQPGDAVLLRTGYGRKKRELGPDRPRAAGRAGWHASCLPWLHERDVALIAADNATDVSPSGYKAVRLPIHAIGIAAMGLFHLDNCDLEDLAVTCAEHDRWEFHFSVAPLRFAGTTGSPVNPIATF